jgi:hypothetical protein
MAINTMPSNVLAQFMPTVTYIFTYFTFSSYAYFIPFNSLCQHNQQTVQDSSRQFKTGLIQNTVQLIVSCSPLPLPAAALCSTASCQLFSGAIVPRLAQSATLSLPGRAWGWCLQWEGPALPVVRPSLMGSVKFSVLCLVCSVLCTVCNVQC